MMQGTDGLMLARVIKFHPHDNSCDCQLIYDNSRLAGVPMMTGMVTGSSGRMDWHEPEGNAWDENGSLLVAGFGCNRLRRIRAEEGMERLAEYVACLVINRASRSCFSVVQA